MFGLGDPAVPIGVFSRERLPFVALRPHDASDDSREIFFLDGEGLCGEGRRQVLLKTARYACTHFTVAYYEDSGTYPPRRAVKIGMGS